MDNQFNTGDVVQLRSGGLYMTVVRQVSEGGRDVVVVAYACPVADGFGTFVSGSRIQHESFDAKMLVMARALAQEATT